MQNGSRMRIERDRGRNGIYGIRTLNDLSHYLLMAEMQTVKGADADHASARAENLALDITKQPGHPREYSGCVALHNALSRVRAASAGASQRVAALRHSSPRLPR